MQKYTTTISAKKKYDLSFKELIKYKDLIFIFVRKNFKTKYAQTILGPIWFIVQPLLTTFVYTLVFGEIANLNTYGVPQFLFYLAGNIPWLFFANCITSTSNMFGVFSRVISKVYFPRLCMPISTIITCFFNYVIDFILFILVWVVFLITGNSNIVFNWYILLTPVLLILMSILGMGIGLIISSITIKFRDLLVLVSFGLTLFMYATPVVFSSLDLSETAYTIIMCNPISPLIEIFRYGFLGVGTLPWVYLGISFLVTILLLILGLILFNKAQRDFVDFI